MLTVSNIFFISALLCIGQLFALCSLLRSGIPGVREWCLANAFAFVAFILYGYGKDVPPIVAYEVANGVYALAMAAMVVGFRRFFDRKVPWALLFATVLLLVAAIAFFRFFYESFVLRTLAVSISQIVFQLAIAFTIVKSRKRWSSPYPYVFTASMAGLVALGNGMRAIIYFANQSEMVSLLQPSFWNFLFLSLGAMVLPILTMGAVMSVHDRMMAKAEHAANRDFLTGAWSRRAFFDLAERELAKVERKGGSLSLLVLDVDYFKAINDSLGHAAGDQVLVDVVLRSEMEIRISDYFARIGGEEFAVLLPDTNLSCAGKIAERLRTALDRNIEHDTPQVNQNTARYTVSIGIAELRQGESFPGLLRRADAALYKAKQSGRNLVVISS
jgi:diguanylate cyclase (GGDEF)-like protein